MSPTVRRQQRWEKGKYVLSAIAMPLMLAAGGSFYQWSVTRQARVSSAVQRENQLMTDLSVALIKTVEVNSKFYKALHEMESACTFYSVPPGASRETAERECRKRYLAALQELDEVILALFWVLPTVPVTSDTYLRMHRLNDRYWLSCDSRQADEEYCGYRALFMRRLESALPDNTGQLKYCADPAVQQDPAHLRACGAEMQRWYEARDQLKTDLRALLCAITRDGNELRRSTWRQMQAEGAALHYNLLAERLEANEDASRCMQYIQENPIRSSSPAGQNGPSKRREL